MTTNKVRALRQQAEDLLTRAAELEEVYANEPEVTEEGESPVIQWSESWGGGPTYTYAAIKVADLWFVTGKHPAGGVTWETLVHQFRTVRRGNFWIADSWHHATAPAETFDEM